MLTPLVNLGGTPFPPVAIPGHGIGTGAATSHVPLQLPSLASTSNAPNPAVGPGHAAQPGVPTLPSDCSIGDAGAQSQVLDLSMDLGRIMDVTEQGFLVQELAPGVSREDFSAACAGRHTFADDLTVIEV